MAGLKKKRRIRLIAIAAVLLAIAAGLGIYAGRDAFEFFRSPSQIAEDPPRAGERFRLGGLVKEAPSRAAPSSLPRCWPSTTRPTCRARSSTR